MSLRDEAEVTLYFATKQRGPIGDEIHDDDDDDTFDPANNDDDDTAPIHIVGLNDEPRDDNSERCRRWRRVQP